jgi:hypothetical protein
MLDSRFASSAGENGRIKQWRQGKLDRRVCTVGSHGSYGVQHPRWLGQLIVRDATRRALLVKATQQARDDVKSACCALILVQRQHGLGHDIRDVAAKALSGVSVPKQ